MMMEFYFITFYTLNSVNQAPVDGPAKKNGRIWKCKNSDKY